MIQPSTSETFTLKPNAVRYSLRIDDFTRHTATLQRAQRNADGTWVDDPRPDASRTITVPTTHEATLAIAGIRDLVFAATGVSGRAARIRLDGLLDAQGRLDVRIIAQIQRADYGWEPVKVIPSLNRFLEEHPDMADAAAQAWAAMDAVIHDENARQHWV